MSNFRNGFKTISGIVCTIGIGAFFGNMTATLVTKTGMKITDVILSGLGADLLSSYLAAKTSEGYEGLIDEIFDNFAIEKKEDDEDEHAGEGDVSVEQPQE